MSVAVAQRPANAPAAGRIVLLSEGEAAAVGGCLAALARRKPQIYRTARTQLDALHSMAGAVSSFASILGEQTLGPRYRSVETLVEALRDLDDTDRELRIPTKAVLGRSLVVAKINFLVMLHRLGPVAAGLRPYRRDLEEALLQNVLALMREDVFVALIEDGRCGDETRAEAARRLAAIWEFRLDSNLANHAPVLLSLWHARRSLRPIYGTMMGTAELTRLTLRVEPGWAEFLSSRAGSQEVAQAMEEFLFGLSYEELARLRDVMARRGLEVVSPRRVSAIIGARRTYAPFENSDPRRLYEFYRQRRSAAYQRRAAGRPGPQVTVEELLLRHLLESEAPVDRTEAAP